MKTKMKLWLTAALLLACVNEVGAQIYEAWPIGKGKSDTAIVVFQYAAPEGNDKYLRTPSNDFYLREADTLMRGTKLTMKDKAIVDYYDKSLWSMFTIFSPDKRPLVSMTDSTGQAFYVDPVELKFSEDNAEGTENPISKYTEMRSGQRSLYKGDFLIGVWIFLWIAWRLCRRAEKIGMKKFRRGKLKPHNWLIGLLLVIAPVVYFFVVVIEINAVTSLGADACWWLNGAYVGDFTRLFLMVLLFMAMRWQYKMIDSYATGMEAFLCTREYVPRKELMWGIVISVVIFAVLAIIGMFVYTYAGSTAGTIVLYTAAIAGVGMLLYTFFAQFVQMVKAMGWILSIIYMIFIILWAVGTIIIIGVFIWQLTKLIIPFIVLALFGQMIPALKLDKPSPGQKVFYDDSGNMHYSMGARDSANYKIREGKQ